MRVAASFGNCIVHSNLYTPSWCRWDQLFSAWPVLLQEKAKKFMQGILASLPGSPAVCSLNCISRPRPCAPVQMSCAAEQSSAEDAQTPGSTPHNDVIETPAPYREQMACSPMSCSFEQPTPVLEAPNSLAAAPWLVISRMEPGQPPLIMQIHVDDSNSNQHASSQCPFAKVILG